MDQKQPRCLHILNQWNAAQQRLVLGREHLQLRCHEILVTQRSSQILMPRRHEGNSSDPPPHHCRRICNCCGPLQLITSWGLLACCIPDLGFSLVDTNSRLGPQTLFQDPVHLPHALWHGDCVNVVQECQQEFSLVQLFLHLQQRRVLAQENNNGIIASPCSPPSPCLMVCTLPAESSHKYWDGAP